MGQTMEPRRGGWLAGSSGGPNHCGGRPRSQHQGSSGSDRNAGGADFCLGLGCEYLHKRRSWASRETKIGVANGGREIMVEGMGKTYSRGKGDGEGTVIGEEGMKRAANNRFV